MALKQVRKLPDKLMPKRRESCVAKDVREFLRQGMHVAQVSVEGKKASYVGTALKKYINDHQDTCSGIASCVRGG